MPAIKSLTMTYAAVREDGTFSEGDTITGKVTLALFKSTTVESLFVKLKGDASVRWTVKSGDKTITYDAQRRYFKLKQMLIPESATDTLVTKGVHDYNFSFEIPRTSMPSTFIGSHGKIMYKLEAKLSRTWRIDRTVEKTIIFVSKTYPNLHAMMSRQVGTTNKAMGFFSKGSVQMQASIDKKAYAPGEAVVIVAKINNASSSDMTPKFTLSQCVLYKARGHTKSDNSIISKGVDSCLRAHTQKEVRCIIGVPRNQIPTIQNCDILSVEYHVKVYLDISFAFDPEVVFPVVIIPRALVAGPQPGAYQAISGPSNSDFPPAAVPMGYYPASPSSGSNRSPVASGYSTPPPVYPVNQPAYAGPPGIHAAQPSHLGGGYSNPMGGGYSNPMGGGYSNPMGGGYSNPMGGGYSNPMGGGYSNPMGGGYSNPMGGGYSNPRSQQGSPYGSPFSSPSHSPFAPIVHPPPPAQAPAPSAPPLLDTSPTVPVYNPPSAPVMNTDFLSQSDEPPPAYSLLFPSSPTEEQ